MRNSLLHILLYAGVGGKVGLYKLFGVLSAKAHPLREAKGRDTVDYAKVGHLGPAALLLANLLRCNPKYLCRSGSMNIRAIAESLQKMRVAAHMRHKPKLYLRVVCRENEPLRIGGHKGLPYLPSALCSNRNILQVGIIGAEPSRSSKCLIKCSVHLAIQRRDKIREGICIGRDKLLYSPIFQDKSHHRRSLPVGVKSLLVCGITPLCALLNIWRNAKPLKEQRAHLLWRREINPIHTRKLPHLALNLCQLQREPGAITAQLPNIHLNPIMLHSCKHLNQRHLNLLIKPPLPIPLQFLPDGIT